jgi:hypothetical protein
MNWVLVIWMASASQYTVYDRFQSEEQCLDKHSTVSKALYQAGSKASVECRQRKPGESTTRRGDVVVSRYVLR